MRSRRTWIALGLALIPAVAIPFAAVAMSGATPSDSGLASGLVNTSAQVGGALGLAVLATLASDRTESLRADGETPLYDGIVKAAEELGRRPERRRAILLVSDGADTRSRATWASTSNEAASYGWTEASFTRERWMPRRRPERSSWPKPSFS